MNISSNFFKNKSFLDFLIVFVVTLITFFISGYFDFLEHIFYFSRAHENWEIDEIFFCAIVLVILLSFFSFRRVRELKRSEKKLAKYNEELQNALLEIKQLKGIIPICASCKKIRDDEGYWHQVEVYLQKHTEAEFSHGICPDCKSKLYPHLNKN